MKIKEFEILLFNNLSEKEILFRDNSNKTK